MSSLSITSDVSNRELYDAELEIEYETDGLYFPATRWEPAEYPEIIITSVVAIADDGSETFLDESDFSTTEWSRLVDAANENHNRVMASRHDAYGDLRYQRMKEGDL